MKKQVIGTAILGMVAAVVAVGSIKPDFVLFGASSSQAKIEVRKSVARQVASSNISEERLEKTFDELMNARDTAATTRSYLKRVVGIYFRSQAYLEKFDEALLSEGENMDIFKNEDYVKLQAARILMERERERIVDLYQRATAVVRTKSNNSKKAREMEDKALTIRSEIRKFLDESKNDVTRLALGELSEELQRAFIKIQKGDKNVSEKIGQEIPTLSFRDAAESSSFYEVNNAKVSDLAKQSLHDKETTEAIEKFAVRVKADIREEATRDPQQVSGIVPSAASNGNINGSNFPSWAITFDDGPNRRNTSAILANLDAQGHKASFFWLSKLAPSMPDIVNAVKASGHDLANHSHSHAQLTKLGSSGLEQEITASTQALARVYGRSVKLFRCPYGACGSNGSAVRQKIAANGMIHVAWTVDSLDWQDKNSASVFARVKAQMGAKKGGVILFHDIQAPTVETARRLGADFQARGIKLRSVEQILGLRSVAGGGNSSVTEQRPTTPVAPTAPIAPTHSSCDLPDGSRHISAFTRSDYNLRTVELKYMDDSEPLTNATAVYIGEEILTTASIQGAAILPGSDGRIVKGGYTFQKIRVTAAEGLRGLLCKDFYVALRAVNGQR